jgi:hydrogenase maturation factor
MPTVREILDDPTASNWIKRALTEALNLDAVDMANDAEVLALLLSARADNLADNLLKGAK